MKCHRNALFTFSYTEKNKPKVTVFKIVFPLKLNVYLVNLSFSVIFCFLAVFFKDYLKKSCKIEHFSPTEAPEINH